MWSSRFALLCQQFLLWFRSPSLWDTPGWLPPAVQIHFCRWHQCQLPGSPGTMQTAQRGVHTRFLAVCFIQTLENHLAFPSLCNRELLFVFKLQRKVCSHHAGRWGADLFPFATEWHPLPRSQSAPRHWWDRSAPSLLCLPLEQGSEPDLYGQRHNIAQRKSNARFRGPVWLLGCQHLTLMLCCITQHSLDKSHNHTVPLFPSIESG